MLQRFGRLRGRARLAVVGGLVVALVIGITGVAAIVAPSRAVAGQSTLTILTGTAEVKGPTEGAFSAQQDGAILESGSTIRTGPDGNVVITFFDGSTVTVEPNSELMLEKLEARGNGDTIISLVQTLGYSWHVVAKKLTPGSQYQVRSPSATASVRGTKFEFEVDDQGKTKQTTHEGAVANQGAQGAPVVTEPGKQVEVAPNAPPSAPVDAPEPAAVVKITIDANNTQSAAAVDANGRAVGVIGGQPVTYAPGGSTKFTQDGKIEISIPQRQPGRVSTVVKSDNAQPVQIETKVESKGQVVANTVELRKPDENGIAKGGIATTSQGMFVLPDSEAKKFTAPDIGQVPTLQTAGGFPLFGGGANVALPTPLIQRGPAGSLPPGGGPGAAPTGGPGAPQIPIPSGVPFDVGTGEFKGGFQAFGNFGAAGGAGGGPTTPGGGPTANTGLVSFSSFSQEQLSFLTQFIPNAPPGASDASKAVGFGSGGLTFTAPTGGQFPTGGAPFQSGEVPGKGAPIQTGGFPGQGGPVATGFPGVGPGATPGFPGQGIPFSTTFPGGGQGQGGQGGFPFGSAFPFATPGANPFGVGPSPFTTGQSPTGGQGQGAGGAQGDCRQTPFGLICAGAGGSTTNTPTTPAGAPGTFPGGGATGGSFPPGVPFQGGGAAGGSFPPGFSFQPGTPGQAGNPIQGGGSFPPGASFPAGAFPGAPGQSPQGVPFQGGGSFPPGAPQFPAGGGQFSPPPFQQFPTTGGQVTPPPGGQFPIVSAPPAVQPLPAVTAPPGVIAPIGPTPAPITTTCGAAPLPPCPILTGPTPAPILTGPTPAPILTGPTPAPITTTCGAAPLPPCPILTGPTPAPILTGPTPAPIVTGPTPAPIITGPTPAPIITGPTPAPIITGPTPGPLPPPPGPTPP